jgi:hypothetical protein
MDVDRVTEADVIRAAQAAQRDRRELLGLLSDVSNSVIGCDDAGAVFVRLTPALFAAIRRRTSHNN